jgi:hypothetical protein
LPSKILILFEFKSGKISKDPAVSEGVTDDRRPFACGGDDRLCSPALIRGTIDEDATMTDIYSAGFAAMPGTFSFIIVRSPFNSPFR